MAVWGQISLKDFNLFGDVIKELNSKHTYDVCRKVTRIAGDAFLTEVKRNTPIGQYIKEYGDNRVGGTLRKSWKRSEVTWKGNIYSVKIYNNTHYASFVEFGHSQKVGRYVHQIRARLKKRYVGGVYMMTKTETSMQNQIDVYVKNVFTRFLMKKLGRK